MEAVDRLFGTVAAAVGTETAAFKLVFSVLFSKSDQILIIYAVN